MREFSWVDQFRATRNQLNVVNNKDQGNTKKVLCVCSAGILRSPSAALVLSQEPYNYNTRSAGIMDYALIPVTEALLAWCDEVVCMENYHVHLVEERIQALGHDPSEVKIKCLHIPDDYCYREPDLIKLIAERYAIL